MTRKQLFVRSALTLALPVVLIWVFVEALYREMRSAVWHAWNDVQQNIAAYRDQIKREDY